MKHYAKTLDYQGNRRWFDDIVTDGAARILKAADWSGLERYGYDPI